MKKLVLKPLNRFELLVFPSVEAAWFFSNGEPLKNIKNVIQYNVDINDSLEIEWLGSEFDHESGKSRSFSHIRGAIRKRCLYDRYLTELFLGWVPTLTLTSNDNYEVALLTQESTDIEELFFNINKKLLTQQKPIPIRN